MYITIKTLVIKCVFLCVLLVNYVIRNFFIRFMKPVRVGKEHY